MYAPVYEAVDVPAVQALLKTGTGPLRFYLFGKASQNTPLPYAVWQTAYGSPENYLDRVPDVDSFGIQIDVYTANIDSQGATKARQIAQAIRDAIEPYAHVVSWRGDSIDPQTNHCRFSFDVDWWVNR